MVPYYEQLTLFMWQASSCIVYDFGGKFYGCGKGDVQCEDVGLLLFEGVQCAIS